MKVLFSALGLVLLMATSSFAYVELVNEDSFSHDIVIEDGISTFNTSINSSTRTRACNSDTCTITVEGIGSIEASGDVVVVIDDGELFIKD